MPHRDPRGFDEMLYATNLPETAESAELADFALRNSANRLRSTELAAESAIRNYAFTLRNNSASDAYFYMRNAFGALDSVIDGIHATDEYASHAFSAALESYDSPDLDTARAALDNLLRALQHGVAAQFAAISALDHYRQLFESEKRNS
jgi:hypothetical protein